MSIVDGLLERVERLLEPKPEEPQTIVISGFFEPEELNARRIVAATLGYDYQTDVPQKDPTVSPEIMPERYRGLTVTGTMTGADVRSYIDMVTIVQKSSTPAFPLD